jgi:hypothetical protein
LFSTKSSQSEANPYPHPKAEALLDRYPMRLDESEHESERKEGGGTSKGGDTTSDGSPAPPGTGGGVRGSGESSERTRVSVRSSRHVSEFVRVYEVLPEECSRLPIKIKGCPAKTYAQAFLHVSEAVDAQGRVGLRHIYWGDYERFRPSESGTSIYFKGSSGNGLPLGVWIIRGIGTPNFRKELAGRLKRAGREPGAKIYALGRFKLWRRWKYTLDLDKLHHLWISFPDDNAAQQP